MLDLVDPGPAGGRRLPVDEGGEANLGRHSPKRGDQLPRIDLGAAGLAGHQEDEIETDVHAGECGLGVGHLDWPRKRR